MTTRSLTAKTKPLVTTLAALTLMGLLGACSGGGGGDGDDVASVSGDDTEAAQGDEEATDEEAEQALFDWAECMRDEGVDIPDPTRDADGNLVIEGNGISLGGGENGFSEGEEAPEGAEEPTIDPGDMAAAEEACGTPPMTGGGELSEEDIQAQQDAALEFADCMREEGIEDFPDPDFSDQGPGGQATTNSNDATEGGGEGPTVAGPFGELDLSDPEIAAAFEACQDIIGPPPGEGGEGPGEVPPADEAPTT